MVVYLLEKSRLTYQQPLERCYHAFYNIMSDHVPDLKEKCEDDVLINMRQLILSPRLPLRQHPRLLVRLPGQAHRAQHRRQGGHDVRP